MKSRFSVVIAILGFALIVAVMMNVYGIDVKNWIWIVESLTIILVLRLVYLELRKD